MNYRHSQGNGGYHSDGDPMPNEHQNHPRPDIHEKADHPGIYQVRPDRNTSIIAVAAFGVFAWLASNWAGNVQDDAEEARMTAQQAQQINEQQTQILSTLPDRIDQMMQSTVVPLQQRLDDMRARESDAYTRDAAQRDIAEQKARTDQLRQEINANQSTISTAVGRVDSLEKSMSEVNRRLEQIYQAVMSSGRSNSSYNMPMAHPLDAQTLLEATYYE